MNLKLACLVTLITSTLSLSIHAQKINDNIFIYGTIKNSSGPVEVLDRSETGPLQISGPDRFFVPDSQGQFSFHFHLDSSKYFRIGRNTVYLTPGDSLEAFIDYNDPYSASYKGSHSLENEYLITTTVAKGGSFLEGGTNVKGSIEETVQEVLRLAQKRREYLYSQKNISERFVYLENNRIKADILNSIYSLRGYYPLVHKLDGDSMAAFQKNFKQIIQPYIKKYVCIPLNADLLQLEVYQDMLFHIIDLKDTTSSVMAQINDWLLAKGLAYEMQTSKIESDSAGNSQRLFEIKTPEYRKEVLATYQKLLGLNGKDAYDLTLIDQKNKKVQLSSFKGKVIFIDVWASWCLPCIKEQPYLDAVAQKFKNNPDVVFISLSIDTEVDKWKNYIKKVKPAGLHFVIDRFLLNKYMVIGIPRTIMIDKDFKIYAMQGPMPSSKQTMEVIQGAVGK
jgi:thiol-disulfide isomerase/thioredoxin